MNELTGDRVHSVEVSDLVVIENTAFFSFVCDDQSSAAPCERNVVVQDNGEGAGDPPDTITVTGVGFTGAAGAVDGDVEIHGGDLSGS